MDKKDVDYMEKIRKAFIERFCKAALQSEDEQKIQAMKQCLALIGDL